MLDNDEIVIVNKSLEEKNNTDDDQENLEMDNHN